MAERDPEQIKKVRIEGLEKPEDGDSSELDKSQLDKVSGGGSYGQEYDDC